VPIFARLDYVHAGIAVAKNATAKKERSLELAIKNRLKPPILTALR